MKDYTKPAFDLSRELLRKTFLIIFGCITFVIFSFIIFLGWVFRTQPNPSVRSWTGENP